MAGRKTTFSDVKGEDTGAWLVTFSDLIMLLLTFFVLLLTMSSMDTKKLKETFAHFRGGAPGVLELTSSKDINGLADFICKYQTSDNLLVLDRDRIRNLLMPIKKSNKKELNTLKEIYNQIRISDDERGVVMSFQEKVLFEPGQSVIKKKSMPFLDSVAEAIKSCPNDVVISGHTDSSPVKIGTLKSNWHLSFRRALSVYEYLLNKGDLLPSRFALGAYGASKPLHPVDSLEDRTLNRRVEIIFKHL